LSAFYLDIIKDRLYVCAKDSPERRSAQTGLWLILMLLLQDMAPILSFTAEEVYQHLPEAVKPSSASVFGLRFEPDPAYLPAEKRRQTLELAKNIRSEVNKAIEPVRQSGKIGHSLDTHVTLYGDDKLLNQLTDHDLDLKEMLIVSKISLRKLSDAPEGIFTSEEVSGLKVEVESAPGSKCERCWMYDERPGTDPNHPTLCPRCAGVMALGD
ncbi:MAG: class I tRNA ligase family protein, partial [Thermodesulfobacteriota bacterium]|nr:class I tRNA ligase family protein [Thermodesulfobacteriota bacterium]